MDLRLMGLKLDDVGVSILWGEAIDLVSELLKRTGSHLYASVNRYTYVASVADLAQIQLAQWFLQANSDPKKKVPEPFVLPFSKPDPNADVTPQRRAELRAQLERRSAFR